MALSKDFISGVREQLKLLDAEISTLTKHRSSLASVLGEPAPTAKAKVSKGVNGKAKVKGTRAPRKGYIEALVPFMFERTETSNAAMLTELQRTFPSIKANNLAAAVQNELKKGEQARIERVRPGVYKLTAAGVDAATVPQVTSAAADAPAQPEVAQEEQEVPF